MPASLILQTAAPFTNMSGGLENIGPITYTGTIVPFWQSITLVEGLNTVAVPVPTSGTIAGLLVVLPPTGGVLVFYKEVSGDTGIPIPQTNASPFVRIFDQANLPSNVYFDPDDAIIGPVSLFWF